MAMKKANNIDEFISAYPKDVQVILKDLRKFIQDRVPEAKEKIAYGIPTFTFHGNLVHFSAYENHIGFYPGAAPIAEFAKDLKAYETSKGTVRFPIHKPLPYKLIGKLVDNAVKRNLDRIKNEF